MKINASFLAVFLVLLVFGTTADASEGRQVTAKTDAVTQKTQPTNRQDTNEIFVKLKDGVDAKQFANSYGLTLNRSLRAGNNEHVFGLATVEQANRKVNQVLQDPSVAMAANNQRLQYQRHFTPNDPLFGANSRGGQWHLQNNLPTTISPGIDANLQGAWDLGYTGKGVNIGIVDDGLQRFHPDLQSNYNSSTSFDFGDGDSDPSPTFFSDAHGTSVAGVAAARGGNGIGGTGAAPHADLSGLRVDFFAQTADMFRDATLYQADNIAIKNHSYGIRAPYISDAGTALQADAVQSTPQTIHVFAAGNERSDTSTKINSNLTNAIVVGAVGSDGKYASYSNYGASMIVSAPSSSGGLFSITTTDRTGLDGYNAGTSGMDFNALDGISNPADNTASFGGTSSAAPLVSGVLALGKEANPNMDTRMAKHLIVRTSAIVDGLDFSESSDGGWRTNGAGNTFNQNYGFGVIDAGAFVLAAEQYTGVTDMVTESTGSILVDEGISESAYVEEFFSLEEDMPLEELLVTMDIDHTFRGDLSAHLTSPMGFRSRLFASNFLDSEDDIENWVFQTVAFWGESGAGEWKLELGDNFLGDSGTWNSFSVTARYGALVAAVPEPSGGVVLVLLAVLSLRSRIKS